MPPTIPPSDLRQLQVLGGAGVTVAELTRAIAARAGQQPPTAAGIATLTWAASTGSGILTVTHGLGVEPAAVVASSYFAPSFGKVPLCNTFGYSAATFDLNAELRESYTGTITVAWFAIGS